MASKMAGRSHHVNHLGHRPIRAESRRDETMGVVAEEQALSLPGRRRPGRSSQGLTWSNATAAGSTAYSDPVLPLFHLVPGPGGHDRAGRRRRRPGGESRVQLVRFFEGGYREPGRSRPHSGVISLTTSGKSTPFCSLIADRLVEPPVHDPVVHQDDGAVSRRPASPT
jgi:hypothetical protein